MGSGSQHHVLDGDIPTTILDTGLQAKNSSATGRRKCKRQRLAHELLQKIAIISPAYTRSAKCRRGR